jgi:hypothetical protein
MSPLLLYGWSLSALKSRRTSLRADELNSVRGVGLPWVIRTYSGISSKGAYRAVSSGADDLETPQSECRPHGYFIAQREARRYPHQRQSVGKEIMLGPLIAGLLNFCQVARTNAPRTLPERKPGPV